MTGLSAPALRAQTPPAPAAAPQAPDTAAEPLEAAAGFTVAGVNVDVAAPSAAAARDMAFRIAARKAWPLLWARLNDRPAAEAPKLGDSALDGIVAGIDIETERFSTTRYIGRLSVVFDRKRAAPFLGGSARVLQSEPMLLMPLLSDGGARMAYSSDSPWLAAWRRFPAGASPVDYVRVPAGPTEAMLLNGWQATRADRNMWRSLLTRYRSGDVLTASVELIRSYPGGPVLGIFEARHGPDAQLLARVRLKVARATSLDQLMDEGVRRLDAVYVRALRGGLLKADEKLAQDLMPVEVAAPVLAPVETQSGIEVTLVTADANAWARAENALRAVPGMTSVSLASLSLGGNSVVRLSHEGSIEMLIWQLDQRGWRLIPQERGYFLRPRIASDPRAPRPVSTLPVETLPAAAAPSGRGPVDLVPAPARKP